MTFLTYDDFYGKRLPELSLRIKVDLRTLFVSVFDHSEQGQILFYKERFLPPEDPEQEALLAYSKKLAKIGIDERFGTAPDKEEFLALLDEHGLTENLYKRRKKTQNEDSMETLEPAMGRRRTKLIKTETTSRNGIWLPK